MTNLNSEGLLGKVLEAISEGGWKYILYERNKPFAIRVYHDSGKSISLRIYIWNCTHGGGKARSDDEYRIQITGAKPITSSTEKVLILGWHARRDVFAAFDINKHNDQAGYSPSLQVKDYALDNAYRKAFSTYRRQNGEIVVAFRPEMLMPYVLSSDSLHAFGSTNDDLSLLNNLPEVDNNDIDGITDPERKVVISQIARRYREASFRARVLSAYQYKCAFCGLQLNLLEAAHILPICHDLSHDRVDNGLSLCALHHLAYDKTLVSVDDEYSVEINDRMVTDLRRRGLSDGLDFFYENLREKIILPVCVQDYPSPDMLNLSRQFRKWGN